MRSSITSGSAEAAAFLTGQNVFMFIVPMSNNVFGKQKLDAQLESKMIPIIQAFATTTRIIGCCTSQWME